MMQTLKNYRCSVFLVVFIWVICLIPIPDTPLDDVRFIDKWTHFAMYAVLTLCIWWESGKTLRKWGRIVVLPIIMGGLVELAQAHLTTCRSGDVLDFCANSFGVVIGTVFALVFIQIRK